MLTDSDRGETPPTCRHKWVFVLWYRDPITRSEGSTHDFRHMVERCRRCAVARISTWFDQTRMRGNTFADTVKEAILGKPYTVNLVAVTAKVAAN